LEATVSSIRGSQLLSRRGKFPALLEASSLWILGFALTTYLALSGGGYDIVPRSQIGLVLWWLLLLGLVTGILPRVSWSAATRVGAAVLAGFFIWTWLATVWTTNQEDTLIEVGRVATYAGPLVLGASALSRNSGRALVYGLASGIAVVCAVAVLSKLLPSLYPGNPTSAIYLTPRLSYPFDYSDGVGEFAALGVPLLWFVSSGARSIWGRALGGAGLPVVLLCLGMTVSRGGILATVLGALVFLALSPDRLPKLVSGLIGALATFILMVALISRHTLAEGLTVAPAGQRHSMLLILLVVVGMAAVVQAAVATGGRRWSRPAWSLVAPKAARTTWLAIASAVLAGAVLFFATGTAHKLWEQFKQPNVPTGGSTYFRLLSVAGSHRYQYWRVALRAFDSSPWHGIGPGTFQFYWAQHQKLGEYVLNAHSLWIETLAELGIIGLVLLAGFFAWTIITGAVRASRLPAPERATRVAAVSSLCAFCAAAAFDWDWQIGVIPLLTMFLAAFCLSSTNTRVLPDAVLRLKRRGTRRLAAKGLLAAAALVALWAIARPLGTTVAVRASQRAASRGQLVVALKDAADAQRLEPEAASPRLQRALILEQLGAIGQANQAINAAVRYAPTDWEIWLVASRLATEQDKPALALRDYRRARSLNPRSPIFGG
jgi:O-antigen ligase